MKQIRDGDESRPTTNKIIQDVVNSFDEHASIIIRAQTDSLAKNFFEQTTDVCDRSGTTASGSNNTLRFWLSVNKSNPSRVARI